MEEYRGGCLCGRIRFVAAGAPLLVGWCHCASCRRQTGAPAACYADFAADRIRFTTAPERYASSPGVFRAFCGACGTPLSFASEAEPEKICLHVGAFDDPAAFRPTAESFSTERLPWSAPPLL